MKTEADHSNATSSSNLKSMSTRGPGRGDTCYLTDFSETWPDWRTYPI